MRLALGFALSIMALPAQQGTYTYYGSPCLGTGFNCADNNPLGGDQPSGGNTNEFALDAPAATDPLTVLGFELWTRSTNGQTVALRTALYLEAAGGRPADQPIATGTMQVGTTSAWQTVLFPQSVVVPRNTRYFLSFGGSADVLHPLVLQGSESAYFWRTGAGNAWNRASVRKRWAWKVLCGSGEVSFPEIFSTDTPTIDRPLRVQLRFANATTPAVLFTGTTQVSFPLAGLGATGCTLLTLPILQVPVTTDAAGRAGVSFLMPNDASLVGKSIYHQWAVVDLSANPFGIVFTAGGNATVGA